jgi:RND family efflux transporter MFP subunit
MKMLAKLWIVVLLTAFTVPAVAEGQEAKGAGPLVFNAWLEPGRQLTLQSASDGQVEKVLVTVGQRVQTGDLLIELDDTWQKMAVERAKLHVEQQRLQQAQAAARTKGTEVRLEATRKLAEKSAIGRPELLSSQQQSEVARLEQQEAEIETRLAELALDAAQQDLESTRIRAPFDGTVSRIVAAPGAFVESGQRLGELIDTSRLVARVPLPLSAARRLRGRLVGTPARVTAGTPDAGAEGRVHSLSPVAESTTGYVEAVGEFDGADGEFIPGEEVTVHIAASEPKE